MMNRCVAGGVTVLLTCLLASLASGQTGSGQFELISATPAGAPAGGQAYFDQLPYDRGPQKISADNRYVVFASPSGQIVAGDTNGRQDIFLRDRATATMASARWSRRSSRPTPICRRATRSASVREAVVPTPSCCVPSTHPRMRPASATNTASPR